MKTILIVLVLTSFFLLGSVIEPPRRQAERIVLPTEQPTLQQPLEWPSSLDDLYGRIDAGSPGYVFTSPCPADPGPSLTWREAGKLHADDEDKLFYAGILAAVLGQLHTCKPVDDTVLFYGPALPGLMEMTR